RRHTRWPRDWSSDVCSSDLIASAAWAFDTPARQSLLPMLVPLKDFQNAVSLSMLMFQMGMIAGPPLAGFLLAGHSPALVYALNRSEERRVGKECSSRGWSCD